MSKITVQDKAIIIKEGLTKKTVMQLDNLRLLYLFLPENLKSWFVVSSTSGIEGYDLDQVSDENIEGLSRKFDDLIKREKAGKLTGIKLILADYGGQSVILPFKDIKKSKIDMFATLLRFRQQRLSKLSVWLQNTPEATLKGLMGQQALLSKQGYRRGKKFLAWQDVGNLEINTVNMSTHFLVIPKGVSTGFFSMKKHKYSMLISIKKKELYIAECDFWMTRVNQKTKTKQKKAESMEAKAHQQQVLQQV